jgi:hypothetical protein
LVGLLLQCSEKRGVARFVDFCKAVDTKWMDVTGN